MRTSTRLASIELLDSATQISVRLGELWREQPAVLIFVRHFG